MTIRSAKKPTRNLGVGVGMREKHYPVILAGEHAPARWIEVNAEKYLERDDGRFDSHLQVLELVREQMPVVLHGTSLSLGSVDHDSTEYLKQLVELVDRIEPELVSDHLCWSGTGGVKLFDLLPVPFQEESIEVLVSRISAAQDALQRRILVENLSSYLELESSDMTEWEFISEVARRADCYLLLDINNVYVSCQNHGWDPYEFVASIPHERVYQIHLAGFFDRGDLKIDTHGELTADPVWDLYRFYIERFGPVSSMIEWDNHVPEWPVMAGELEKIERVLIGPGVWGAAAGREERAACA